MAARAAAQAMKVDAPRGEREQAESPRRSSTCASPAAFLWWLILRICTTCCRLGGLDLEHGGLLKVEADDVVHGEVASV